MESARATIGPDHVGAVMETGFITDIRTLLAVPLPHPRVFDQGFHRICGSSTVAQLRPDEADPLRRDPFSALRSHHRWIEVAEAADVELARLPVVGNYVVNTSENHSELHSHHVAWRKRLAATTAREGRGGGGSQERTCLRPKFPGLRENTGNFLVSGLVEPLGPELSL